MLGVARLALVLRWSGGTAEMCQKLSAVLQLSRLSGFSSSLWKTREAQWINKVAGRGLYTFDTALHLYFAAQARGSRTDDEIDL